MKHFEEKYYKKGKNSKRYRLAMYIKPVPTVFYSEKIINKNSETNNFTSPISIPPRSPRELFYQEDQYDSFISKDSVKNFTCLNESFSPMSYFTI